MKSFLSELILGILKWLTEWGVRELQKPDIAEDGIGPGALEERLKRKVRKDRGK